MEKMDINNILEYLPHRYPFLLIDRIVEIHKGQSIVAIKNVTMNEPYFTGHFPDQPVMPGVMIVEGMAQACGLLAKLTSGDAPGTPDLYYFAGIDDVRFKRVVYPGDRLQFNIEMLRNKRGISKYKTVATVDDAIVCTAEIMLAKKMKELS